MENIKQVASPSYLPQLNMPFGIVLGKLDDLGIGYKNVEINPKNLVPSQAITFSDKVDGMELSDNNPIWVSTDGDDTDKIIDGHHRYCKALDTNTKLKAIKVNLDHKNAVRVLNKIQDIFEYEQAMDVEEVIAQDVVNQDNDIDSGISDSEFLASLEEDNLAIQTEKPSNNQKTIIAYRKGAINNESTIGNFFILEPVEGYDKYEIEFENLLDTNTLGITYKESQIPVDILAKIWFPHVNFEKIAEQQNTEAINIKNKAIAEKAKKLKYDGIQYGKKLVQGLK